MWWKRSKQNGGPQIRSCEKRKLLKLKLSVYKTIFKHSTQEFCLCHHCKHIISHLQAKPTKLALKMKKFLGFLRVLSNGGRCHKYNRLLGILGQLQRVTLLLFCQTHCKKTIHDFGQSYEIIIQLRFIRSTCPTSTDILAGTYLHCHGDTLKRPVAPSTCNSYSPSIIGKVTWTGEKPKLLMNTTDLGKFEKSVLFKNLTW